MAAVLACIAASLGVRAQSHEPAPLRDVVYIAAGWFTMGSDAEDVDFARRLCVRERAPAALRVRGCASDELFANETPARRVFISAYLLDRFELSRADYEACMRAGACEPPSLEIEHPDLVAPDRPMSGITWFQAEAACRYRGGRIPTEAEWERAARGDTQRRFPWGRFYNETFANHGGPAMALDPADGESSQADGWTYSAPISAFAEAKSPHGVVQMAGNVWEWTADGYAPLSLQVTRVDPVTPRASGLRVVRGGSFRSPSFTLRASYRESRAENAAWVDVGVRCAYDPLGR
jgi:formylglycine-generating enzyme required for sulfatase activity